MKFQTYYKYSWKTKIQTADVSRSYSAALEMFGNKPLEKCHLQWTERGRTPSEYTELQGAF